MGLVLVACAVDDDRQRPRPRRHSTTTSDPRPPSPTTGTPDYRPRRHRDTRSRSATPPPSPASSPVVGIPFNDAIKAVFKQVNDAGGINGRMIEFITYDDTFNAATGVTFTEKLDRRR
ncbi:MAG: ABC transporter substrate-binding protein [Bacillus subtilis]|nr:ABC transporter substrate-binding protein [Bacillus subtilis]